MKKQLLLLMIAASSAYPQLPLTALGDVGISQIKTVSSVGPVLIYRVVTYGAAAADANKVNHVIGGVFHLGVAQTGGPPGAQIRVSMYGAAFCEFNTLPVIQHLTTFTAGGFCVDAGAITTRSVSIAVGQIGVVNALRPDLCANCALINVKAPGTPGLQIPSSYLTGQTVTAAVAQADGTVIFTHANGTTTQSLASLVTPASIAQIFQPSTAYVAGALITQGGLIYSRNGAGTSGVTFAADSANWTAQAAATANFPANTMVVNATGAIAAATGVATLPTANVPAFTGDVTNLPGALANSISPGVVTNAKLANMASNTVKGVTAAGVPTDLTTIPTSTLPALTGDVTAAVGTGATVISNNVVTNAKLVTAPANTIKGNGSGAVANVTDLTILPTAVMPALTGDVTNLAGSLATAINTNAVTNTKAAQMAAGTVKGNLTGALANAADNTTSTLSAALPVAFQPTTAYVAGALTTSGGLIYSRNTAGTSLATFAADIANWTALSAAAPTYAANTMLVNNTGAVAAPVGVPTLPAANFPAQTGDVTNTAGSLATTITAAAVTNTKLSNMPANTVKGVTAAGVPTDLTTIPTPTLPAFTGDVTTTAGTAVNTIATNAVTNAKAAQAPANTIKGNGTGALANVADLTVLPTAVVPPFSGDVTNPAGSLVSTIGANVVTNAKVAQAPANTIKGNGTGALANVTDLTVLPQAVVPAFTGDVTNPAGSLVSTIGANVVTNAKSAQMAATTVRSNLTGSLANVADNTTAAMAANLPHQFQPTTAYVAGALATSGGLIYSRNTAGTSLATFALDISNWTALTSTALSYPANSVVVNNLAIVGPGVGVTTLPAVNFPAQTGDVTNVSGTLAMTISPNVVTNAKSAQMAAGTIRSNITAATANVVDNTTAAIAANLPIPFQALTGYVAGAIVTSSNLIYQRNTAGISLTTFALDIANWTLLSASGVSASFASAAITGTITHNFGSTAHLVQCADGSGFPVYPSKQVVGATADTLTFIGGLVNTTTCIAR